MNSLCARPFLALLIFKPSKPKRKARSRHSLPGNQPVSNNLSHRWPLQKYISVYLSEYSSGSLFSLCCWRILYFSWAYSANSADHLGEAYWSNIVGITEKYVKVFLGRRLGGRLALLHWGEGVVCSVGSNLGAHHKHKLLEFSDYCLKGRDGSWPCENIAERPESSDCNQPD